MSSFQGIWVPLVTPFHNGAIDFVGLRRLVAHLLEKGIDGLVVCGTTAEAGLGAKGAIAASAHVHPELFVALYQQIRDNPLATGRTTFFQLLPLIQSLFIEPNPAPVKTALALEGLIGDELRAPMQRSTEAMVARLKDVLTALNRNNR